MNLKTQFEFSRRQNFVYLDSAATTQVPDSVVRVVKESLEFKGNPHRGAHTVATKNEESIKNARANVARFINAKEEEIVFTNNTTDSINIIVDSIVDEIKKGDEIILSLAEHHSNMLPYDRLIKKGAKFRIIGLKDGIIDVKELESKLNNKTKIVAIQHCSNVLGNINPVERLGKIIKKFNKNIFYIVDGAQAVAHIPVNIKKIKCNFYAFSGHKMYGPDGIGVLFISKDSWPSIEEVKMGGGTISDAKIVFGKNKDKLVYEEINSLVGFEGGTLNVANILGLSEAVDFIRTIGFDRIQKHERGLVQKIFEGLNEINEIEIYGPKIIENKIGVVSFSIKDESVEKVGDYLNKRKICIRYGSHCAFPLANYLKEETLRISLGCYNDEKDIEKVIQEIKFFLDKKKGLIKNPNLEILRDKIYYKNIIPVNSKNKIISNIFSAVKDPKNTDIVIMAGHFLAIPDKETNSFYPSIKPLLPERLHNLLDEFGMTSFPIFSWGLGCNIAQVLKTHGYNAKLTTIINDTTGINELRMSSINKENKTAEQYRDELLARYNNLGKIPKIYKEILNKFKLKESDIINFGKDKFIRETVLRLRFRKFIKENQQYFDDVINYEGNKKGSLDLEIKILDNQQIKTCKFDAFESKTGGEFCIVELCQFLAELFGKAEDVNFEYISKNILEPKLTARNKILVMLTPAMCEDAVTKGAELYTKLMLQEKNRGVFKFFNIPLGSDSEKYLATGAEMEYISDKDNLKEIEVEEEPGFPELWKLCEYELLYDIDEYKEEMEEMFEKKGINKKSKILDTSVGPGFFIQELLEDGYNVSTSDKSPNMLKPFKDYLQEKGIKHKTVISEWKNLDKHFKPNTFDLLLNRGNTFIMANGGWHEKISINRRQTLKAMKHCLKVYYKILKKGGYLYIDKFRDSEIPDKKVVATLKIKKTKEKKDVIFYVERVPEKDVRYAQMLLRDKNGKETGLPNMTYDLTEDEMEDLLKKTGFKIEKLNLKSEKHFVVWLAKK